MKPPTNPEDTGAEACRPYTLVVTAAGASLSALAETVVGAAGRLAAARGGVWLDGQRALDPTQLVTVGSTLVLRLPPAGVYSELELDAAAIAYEDAWLIALHKQAGWYVGATPWDHQGNVLAALGRYLAARDGNAPPLHLAHQLDRDTTGILLLSKAPTANAPLQAAFAGGHVAKRYLALCNGEPPWDRLELHTGHGRAAGGRWRIYPLEQIGQALPAGGGRVTLAHTTLLVEARYGDAALVRALPHTGRTHQIRLHLAHAGHPLLGDVRYAGPTQYRGHKLSGHLLHAAALRLSHPITGAALLLTSPLPEPFVALLASAQA